MISYVIFFLVESTLLFISRVTNSLNLRMLACIVAIGFCGLRFETGYDYNSYRDFFENISIYNDVLELGFVYFIHLGNELGISSFSFFFIFALATHGIAFYTLSKISTNPDMAIFIYLLIPGLYLNSFSVVRSAYALSIFIYAAFKLIKNNAVYQYFVWGLLAASFHITAILPFLLTFIIYVSPKYPISRYLFFILLGVSFLVGFQSSFAQSILNMFVYTKFSAYAEWDTQQSAIKIFSTNLLAIYIIYHLKYFRSCKNSLFFFKIWFIGLLIYNIFMNFTPVTRMTYYFTFFSIPLLLSSIAVYSGKFRILSQSILLIFFSMAFIAALYNDYLATDVLKMSNYKTIFDAP